ncbi:MAG: hypothetical protein LBJ22_05990, partial [Synergistaceae bacterium]|nr:hypothetical protein [Synergistaceae bacterium]
METSAQTESQGWEAIAQRVWTGLDRLERQQEETDRRMKETERFLKELGSFAFSVGKREIRKGVQTSSIQHLKVYNNTRMWYHLSEVMPHGKDPDSINVGTATKTGEILQKRS